MNSFNTADLDYAVYVKVTPRFVKILEKGDVWAVTYYFFQFCAFYQIGLSTEEDSSDAVKNTGYLGDIDTSSNESCESVCSESGDNIPLATSKGTL